MKLDSLKVLETKIDEAENIVYLVSYPNSGRTWVRSLLSRYKQQLLGIDDFNIRLHAYHCRQPYSPQVIFYHAGSGTAPEFTLRDRLARRKPNFPFDLSLCKDSRVVLLVRAPQDALISHYHDLGTRQRVFKGTLEQFIRDDGLGLNRWISFHNFVVANRSLAEQTFILDYANLRQDTSAELSRLLPFLGMTAEQELVKEAVEFSALENMKKLEMNDQLVRPAHQGATNDADKRKVRSGSVGGWRNKLDAKMISYIDARLKAELDPFYLDGKFPDWF
ncbi:MAG: sulfotransferase domain-containing protein [Anaerolineales bacterium]|nr:sulfotransferase domain-containing protein [Anaerolineales bacterium]